MSDPITGGPAFPVVFDHPGCTSEMEGMTLRDYFAAKAMQSLTGSKWPSSADIKEIVSRAYELSDAMLDEREK